eukprot:6209886-Pleurochrysis_carterae.AAC.2
MKAARVRLHSDGDASAKLTPVTLAHKPRHVEVRALRHAHVCKTEMERTGRGSVVTVVSFVASPDQSRVCPSE